MRDQFAGTLSGGQRKLLEMARALMVEPSLVMLDEPMAGVNPALTQSLLGHVKDLRDVEGRSVVFVEHDMDVVFDISDWVVCLAQGRVIAEGPPVRDRCEPRRGRRLPRRDARPQRAARGASPPTRGGRMSTSAPVLVAEELVAGYVPDVDILTGCNLTLEQGELSASSARTGPASRR
jgi:ABC-type multidrug transport system ATPase subunit